jgi:hypothetical protein
MHCQGPHSGEECEPAKSVTDGHTGSRLLALPGAFGAMLQQSKSDLDDLTAHVAASRSPCILARAGTPHVLPAALFDVRCIHARAANTEARPPRPAQRPVHPCSRGEHIHRLPRIPLRHRFIPARAGTTSRCSPGTRSPSVHPRSRGDHVDGHEEIGDVHGSSPLARGPPLSTSQAIVSARFIPARAGTTGVAPALLAPVTVHPRSRGDHHHACRGAVRSDGSSPLARGPPREAQREDPDRRFIPARAGTTWPAPATGPARSVHPRSRGDHYDSGHHALNVIGSSPLARGPP